MKNLFLTYITVFTLSFALSAQVRLDVEGSARVTGSVIELIKPSNPSHILNLSSDGAAMDINATTDLYISSGGNINLDANNPTGRVGIGTANPMAKFHVVGDRMRISTPGNDNRYIDIRTDGAALDISPVGADLYIDTGNDNLILATQKGQVGIGTGSPAERFAKLHVKQDTLCIGECLERGILLENFSGNRSAMLYTGTNGALNFWLFQNNSILQASARLDQNGIWTNSDRKLKTDIEYLDKAIYLNKLRQLRPAAYRFKWMDIPTIGFIAQDVEQVIPDAVDALDNGTLAVNHDKILAVVVKAMQELDEENQKLQRANAALRSTNGSLQKEVEELKSRFAKIESLLQNSTVDHRLSTPTTVLTDAKLEQNAPNPFTENTLIRYFIPKEVSEAELQIIHVNGKVLKEISIKSRGAGQTLLEAQSLSPGTYLYTLILDGEILETKQMMLIH